MKEKLFFTPTGFGVKRISKETVHKNIDTLIKIAEEGVKMPGLTAADTKEEMEKYAKQLAERKVYNRKDEALRLIKEARELLAMSVNDEVSILMCKSVMSIEKTLRRMDMPSKVEEYENMNIVEDD